MHTTDVGMPWNQLQVAVDCGCFNDRRAEGRQLFFTEPSFAAVQQSRHTEP